ncbi:geminin-like isoform X2 [Mizuhopecten yessoensis]|uniref:geminin-like isoform X2 n=1 Tax=Mizuhopecten yessoensis TaxID=6573 RepID=UPI000B457F21|nr:geminin-like isoform X2 [Mizuhopecten yessoensis]
MASKVGQKHQENIQMAAFRGKNSSEDGLTRLAPSDGRKTLQTLQYSAVKDRKSLGKDALLNAQKEKSGKDTIQIYADPKTPDIKSKTFDDKAVQTEKKSKSEEDIDQEAYDLMVNEDIPENYWRDLAERRREALNESLNENEQELVGVSEESEDKSDDQEEEEEQDSCDKDKESENNDTKDTKPDEKSTPEDIDASEDHKDECQSNTEEETS